jgi:Rrf2 family protein
MLSQTAEYALRAALYMAEHPERTPARVGELARALHVPQNYLSKTLHQLARTGVLVSSRGKHGGFRLAREPGAIPLLEIVAPFEHFEQRRQCLLGRPECSDAAPCQAHQRWKEVQERTTAFFRDTTLRDLVRPTVPTRGVRRRSLTRRKPTG